MKKDGNKALNIHNAREHWRTRASRRPSQQFDCLTNSWAKVEKATPRKVNCEGQLGK